ncbi:acyltransferase [Winogradskyella psychrotolerans]|uniref:acyltransferase family protein n=1 Tax=Winogradskyella psychrotolerans TaxID=1344585 RepID=UPI001C078937|nr:acyltransferase [Winogradskyella psychrotolerans]MBU2922167.1 acyltransferase [Winogradskyella psychrotolerans]
MKKKIKHLKDVDVAIGIAIMLVVYGHLLFNVKDLDWFVNSRKLIYKFHMPLFMFFSGFLMSYTYKPVNNIQEYLIFIKKKIKKFLPPYVLFSLIFLTFDYLFYGLSITELKDTVISIFVYPSEGSAGFLWYVYVLLEFYIVFPLIMMVAKKQFLPLLIFTILLQFIDIPKLLGLYFFAFYFLFIVLGIMATKHLELYYKYLSKFGLIFVALFVVILIMSAVDYVQFPKTVMGLASIPAIHYISIKLANYKWSNKLVYIGQHSFYIYLMNTLIMGALFLFFTKVLKINNLELISPVLMVAGTYIPILIYRKIIRKIPILNRIIL